ncbi:MAG: hypothetical protein F6K26_30805 [Moorea sp. SIO2I5]|nr:hypothetical protein [Moorena sp. SIO2I5]
MFPIHHWNLSLQFSQRGFKTALRGRQEARGKRQKFTKTAFAAFINVKHLNA